MSDPTLRWVVTLLFGASIAMYVFILVAQRRRWTNSVDHLLHLAMATSMILMAWDVGMNPATVGTMIFYVLAGLWFARAAGRMSTAVGERVSNGYYAVMTVAMTWMLVVMNGRLPGQIGHTSHRAPSAALAMGSPETNMAAAHQMSPTGSAAQWITTVNWIATLGFAVAALYWACRYVAGRRENPVPHAARLVRLEPLHQMCTAAGTALMFGALL